MPTTTPLVKVNNTKSYGAAVLLHGSCYDESCERALALAAEAGIMVIEGAGSPAEINLKAHDIVNMAMARHARAMVLLVGDIDRGGVFAALFGTWELLEPEERAFVAGFVLNKFRGEAALLAPALDEISTRTGCPFLGVLPWLPTRDLPEEDSAGAALRGDLAPEYTTDKDFDPALDRLAASVRAHLDMERIYAVLGIGGGHSAGHTTITSPALP
jgi:cobyric acid synthase